MGKAITIEVVESDMDFQETPCENCVFQKFHSPKCREFSKSLTGIDCNDNNRIIFKIAHNPAIKIIEDRINKKKASSKKMQSI